MDEGQDEEKVDDLPKNKSGQPHSQ